MKILSKFKDSYDYLIGIYGIDEHIVYDRRPEIIYSIVDELKKKPLCAFKLLIGQTKTFIITDDQGEIYVGKDIMLYISKYETSKEHFEPLQLLQRGMAYYYLYLYGSKIQFKSYKIKEDFIDKLEFQSSYHAASLPPIVLIQLFNNGSKIIAENPKIQGLKLDNVTIYRAIYDYLSFQKTLNEKKVPVGDDKTRIQSAGFDLKKSFRHRKE